MSVKNPIDWAAAHARLEHSSQRLEELSSLEGDRERIFRQRAESLAEQQDSSVSGDEEAIVVLRAGKGLYGVPLSCIAEVLTDIPVAIVPGAPPRFAGVIQVRGEIRPVLHLLRVLGLSADPQTRPATVVLLRRTGIETGLLIDRVEDIRHVPATERHPAPPDSAHVDWMTADMLTVLNVDSLLGEEG